jgi:predicted GNAT family N-acyltransferase
MDLQMDNKLGKYLEIAYGSEEYQQSLALRDRIMRQPLNLQFTEQELAQDKVDHHLAYIEDGQVRGILVMKSIDENTFKMRQVAIDDAIQGLGIGSVLVSFAEDFALQNDKNRIILSARDKAIPFYKRLDYEIVGEGFVEVGIPHHSMEKILL